MLQLDKKSSKNVVKTKHTKGNILIKKDLLNKYNSVKEIFEFEKKLNSSKIIIDCNLIIFNSININYIKIEKNKKDCI